MKLTELQKKLLKELLHDSQGKMDSGFDCPGEDLPSARALERKGWLKITDGPRETGFFEAEFTQTFWEWARETVLDLWLEPHGDEKRPVDGWVRELIESCGGYYHEENEEETFPNFLAADIFENLMKTTRAK
jgi:hypothetical protein